MISDAHIHFIPLELSVHTTFYKGIWTEKEKLFEFLTTSKINKALLAYPSTDAHVKLGDYGKVADIYNKEIEKITKVDERIIVSALINHENLNNIASELATLKSKGFKAINLASSYGGKFSIEKLTPLFQALQQLNLPVFVHPQTLNPIGFDRVKDPLLMPVLEYSFDNSMFMGLLMMEGVLENFDIKFIFSSLGGVMPFLKERFDRVYTMLRRREMVKDLGKLPSQILNKIYVDTAGASLAHIKLAIELFGEDHILWGSDYPVNTDVNENITMLDGLGTIIKEKILYKNFSSLFLV